MSNRNEYLRSIDRAWFSADFKNGVNATDVLGTMPESLRAEAYENRARNDRGLCFRSDCGQPLWDDHACAEHSERATDEQRLESRMQRLISPPKRRYY
jgi:hypothetical protein